MHVYYVYYVTYFLLNAQSHVLITAFMTYLDYSLGYFTKLGHF